MLSVSIDGQGVTEARRMRGTQPADHRRAFATIVRPGQQLYLRVRCRCCPQHAEGSLTTMVINNEDMGYKLDQLRQHGRQRLFVAIVRYHQTIAIRHKT